MGYKILFAGGCHVDGGAADGDSKIAGVALCLLREQGIECEASYLIPTRLAHPRRLAQRCREFKPDVLVLQTGHPETSGLLSAHIKRLVGLSARTRIVADFNNVYELFDGSWKTRLKWTARGSVKRLLDVLTGHTLVDMAALAPVVDEFYDRVADLGMPTVIVLSPLPCADPVAMYYRRKLVRLLHVVSEHHRFTLLDTLERGQASYFKDPIHLSKAGNKAIGELLAAQMLCVLQPSWAESATYRA